MKPGQSIRRFARRSDGIASLEFVIILFPMMIFIFGIMEFSLIFYQFNQMENVARETARIIAVDDDVNPAANGVEVTCPGTGGAEAIACQLLSNAAKDRVTACYEQQDFPPEDPVFASVVTVTAPMDQLGLVISVLGVSPGRELTASAEMRVEHGKIDPDNVDPPRLCDGGDPVYE